MQRNTTGAVWWDNATNQIKSWNGSAVVVLATDSFTDLLDTPANFSGAASKVVSVNVGATALEYTTLTTPDITASTTSVDPGTTDRNSVTVSAPLLSVDGDSWIIEAWGVNGSLSSELFRLELLFAPSTTLTIVLQTVAAGTSWIMSMIASRGSSSFWSYRCHTINGATNILASSTGVQDLGTIVTQVKVYTTGSDGHVRGVLVNKRSA